MGLLPDRKELAAQLGSHIQQTANNGMPEPVLVEIIDASTQIRHGLVLGRRGAQTITVRALGMVDLSAATPSAPVVVWAYPPNPGQPGQGYTMIGLAAGGSGTNARVPGIRASTVVIQEASSAPATPPSGSGVTYVKDDGNLYFKNDGGTETNITAGGSGIATVKENGTNVVTSADTLDVKDMNVEDLTGGDAALYLDAPLICQGRLTLTTAIPITTTDVTAATTLYFTPYRGAQISLYDGTRWKKYAFTERSIAVPATTSTLYDVFLYDNAGTLTLELTAWTNDTTRATALVLQDGVYVKSGATTRRYLGSFRTTTVSGQTEDSASRRFVWNQYHQTSRSLICIDTTDSWAYTTATWRPANNNTTVGVGRAEVVIGLSEQLVRATIQNIANNASGVNIAGGIGIDATAANSAQLMNGNVVAGSFGFAESEYKGYLAVGYHYLQRLEISQAVGATTWYGDNTLAYKQTGMFVELEM